MIDFSLPPTSGKNPPVFFNAEDCRHWFGSLPLANALQSQTLLLRQLELLNHYPMDAGERLRILEMLRGPLIEAQRICVQRYAGKPLPPAPGERIVFESTQALWQALTTGYLHCLAAALEASVTSDEGSAQVALLSQRALASLSARLLDIYLAGRLPPAQFWTLAYRIYSASEDSGATRREVEDQLRLRRSITSVAAALAEIVLLHFAQPYELNQRQLGWLSRWARRWAGKVPIAERPPLDAQTVSINLQLDSDLPPGMLSSAYMETRWFDTSELRKSLRSRMKKIEAGAAPAELGLGDDCVMPAAERLLHHVYLHWCKGGANRLDLRTVRGNCGVVGGLPAVHQHLSGKAFGQPAKGMELSRREYEEIATFGRVATHRAADLARQNAIIVEEWEAVEEWRLPDNGSTAMILQRSLGHAVRRASAGQLLALRTQDSSQFLVGFLRWLRLDSDESLQACAHVFPGLPQPAAVRGTGLVASNDSYRAALLLPAIPILKLPTRIVIPAGLFRPDLCLEVYVEHAQRVRLTELIERGSDFDCAGYTVAT